MKNCFIKEYYTLLYYDSFEYDILALNIIKKELNINIFFDARWHYKSFCVECGKRRSVLNFFLLSRMTFKKYLLLGRLSGVKKISW